MIELPIGYTVDVSFQSGDVDHSNDCRLPVAISRTCSFCTRLIRILAIAKTTVRRHWSYLYSCSCHLGKMRYCMLIDCSMERRPGKSLRGHGAQASILTRENASTHKHVHAQTRPRTNASTHKRAQCFKRHGDYAGLLFS
jgi:hypothetical protein